MAPRCASGPSAWSSALDFGKAKLDSEDDLQALSAELSKLAGDLLKDMDAEEDGCLRASLLSAVSLTVERR